MILVGLTGSIGMGKTETAKMFARLGAAVWDADAAVHRLYEKGGAGVEPIRARFPEAVVDDAVDRVRLSAAVVDDHAALRELEEIVHPLVRDDEHAFRAQAVKDGAEIAVFDIPLLFETGRTDLFDAIVVCAAPETVRRARVLARPGMTAEKFEAIRAKQAPEEVKRAGADYLVHTDAGLDAAFREVETIVADLKRRFPEKL